MGGSEGHPPIAPQNAPPSAPGTRAPTAANLAVAATLLTALWMVLAPPGGSAALPLVASLPALRGMQPPPPPATSQPRAISVASFRSPDRFCRANPYLGDWDDARYLSAAEGLVAFRASQNRVALEEKWRAPEWGRFDASPATQPCAHLARYPPDPAVVAPSQIATNADPPKPRS